MIFFAARHRGEGAGRAMHGLVDELVEKRFQQLRRCDRVAMTSCSGYAFLTVKLKDSTLYRSLKKN
ncbi:hypothetical protein [Arboricoccus pini]|uniref:hypothetical protein n=1 Tax=Arboricoccus pini TaxID=1963835 RepID=UPI000B5070EE|nr:hypothetical protein [Arboricoccus pini]